MQVAKMNLYIYLFIQLVIEYQSTRVLVLHHQLYY